MSLSAEKAALKTALETYGRTIDLEIKHGETTYISENIVGCTISYEGGLLTSVMKQAEIELEGVGGEDFAEAMKGERLFITLTATGGETTATKEYGTFIVKDAEYKDETNSIVLICYDLMLEAMTEYSSVAEYPLSLGDYLQIMCNEIGVALATPNFTNSEVIIDEEKYDKSYTKRDILTEIAQAAAGTIAIKDDELYVLYPTESGVTVEPSNLKTIEIGKLYGPVNSVVIARTPQEDNIYKTDESAANICEIKIENNQLMDSHREDFIDGIYNALCGANITDDGNGNVTINSNGDITITDDGNGNVTINSANITDDGNGNITITNGGDNVSNTYSLIYYPHEIESFGIGVLDICDFFTIETLDGKRFRALHLSGEIEITQGLLERSKGAAPEITKTDYTAASKSDRELNKTILRVDKQEQVIQGLVQKTTDIINDQDEKIGELTQKVEQTITPEAVSIKISEAVSGINSIETETGYTFNKDGLHIQKSGEEIENTIDHTGMYVDRSDENVLTANPEGVDAINLKARQFLIIGENSRFEDYEDNRTACFYIGG